MPEPKTNKERVNITVDPAVHQAFSSLAEKQGQSVSGVINSMMGIYAGIRDFADESSATLEHLRNAVGGDVIDADFRFTAGRQLKSIGFSPINLDESDPGHIREISPDKIDEWVLDSGKQRVGAKIVFSLVRQPDLVLGQALMMRGRLRCDVVHLVVPFKSGVEPSILTTIEHAGLLLTPIDSLQQIVGKSSAKREENKKRLAGAGERLAKIKESGEGKVSAASKSPKQEKERAK